MRAIRLFPTLKWATDQNMELRSDVVRLTREIANLAQRNDYLERQLAELRRNGVVRPESGWGSAAYQPTREEFFDAQEEALS